MTTFMTEAQHHFRGVDMILGYAIENERPAIIEYLAASGERTFRVIEPYAREITRDGNLIVRAMDRRSGQPRTFRLDRVDDVALTDGPFELDRAAARTSDRAAERAALARIRAEIEHVDPYGYGAGGDAMRWTPDAPIFP